MHQGQVRVHALEPDVFVLQFAQLRQVRDRHTRELAFPFVIGRLADAVLPARLADLGTQLDLLKDGNDLAFTESGFLHVETPLVEILYSQLDQVSEGASTTANSGSKRQNTTKIVEISQSVVPTQRQRRVDLGVLYLAAEKFHRLFDSRKFLAASALHSTSILRW